MTGIGHTLNIAVGALFAQQYGLSVASHNIANVNTDSYSRQRLSLTTNDPVRYAGILFGSGVDTESIKRSTNQALENRLVQEASTLAAFEGAEAYMNVLEGYFNENTDGSISDLMIDFWNSWHELSNNPSGAVDRNIVYENGMRVAGRFESMGLDLDRMETDLTREIEALITEVNGLTEKIAMVNQEIARFETTGSANDQRDKRNNLVSQLAELVDIYTFEQGDGTLSITTANGYGIVNGVDSYRLHVAQGQVMWENSYGQLVDITDKVENGRVGGLLDMRDEVARRSRAELDVLAREFIWSVNQVHSQGVGLGYFSESVEGTYATDASGLLATLAYGNKIDYTKDFKMWVEDNSASVPLYSTVEIDMGISQADISGWSGVASGRTNLKYVFTVKDAGTVGLDGNAVVTDGSGLGIAQTGADAASVLDAAVAAQQIAVYGGPLGAQNVSVADGGDAERSAASIAGALDGLSGVTAHAFQNSAVLDITALLGTAAAGDGVAFTLSSGSRTDTVSFEVGADNNETLGNFQTAMNNSVAAVNDFGNDLSSSYAGNTVTLTSASGENIGIADFNVQDPAGVVQADTMTFDAQVLTSGSGTDSAVKTGTLTILLDPGLTIQSSAAGAAGSIFNAAADTAAGLGSSILTLGGDRAFSGFDPGDGISFRVDDTDIAYTVGAADVTDLDFAIGMEAALNAAALDPSLYTIRRHGTHVSILKTDGTDIVLTNFQDDDLGGGTLAALGAPPNRLLMANNSVNDSVTSRLFGDRGVIEWESFDEEGNSTRDKGTITIADAGPFEVEPGGLSFTIGPGSLVAGNTFTLNTNTLGQADPLSFQASGRANSISDIYTFRVIQEDGGQIGVDDIEIYWSNNNASGTFTLEGRDPPLDTVLAEVDGMKLLFDGGTLFEDDVFTITTDNIGSPEKTLPTDWQWTIDSFKDQFNRHSFGVKADLTDENRITFSPGSYGNKLDHVRFSGSDGFCEENVSIEVNNYEALTATWPNVEIVKDDVLHAATGGWGISGFTNPGYDVRFVAADGFDLDNGFHVELDGDRAFSVRFNTPISDNGAIHLDIVSASGEYGFAFSDDQAEDSGLVAALGANTFFDGKSATRIEVNSMLGKSRDYIAAAKIESGTGSISSGDNTNSLAIADLQFTHLDLTQWVFETGGEGVSNRVNTTLSDYLSLMVGALGITAQSIRSGGDFSEVMLSQITELRDSVSAVSLDEEMISIMKFQHAFTVASKLLSVSDEMLETLVSMR